MSAKKAPRSRAVGSVEIAARPIRRDSQPEAISTDSTDSQPLTFNTAAAAFALPQRRANYSFGRAALHLALRRSERGHRYDADGLLGGR